EPGAEPEIERVGSHMLSVRRRLLAVLREPAPVAGSCSRRRSLLRLGIQDEGALGDARHPDTHVDPRGPVAAPDRRADPAAGGAGVRRAVGAPPLPLLAG